MMMWPMLAESKGVDLPSCLSELEAFVRSAARNGLPAHELERGLWQRLLQLGYYLQGQYFALAGAGEPGETVTLAAGREVRRLSARHRRPYQSIFGAFELERVVYGTREGQRIEWVPLDARLALPAGKFSYLLQDWDQALAVENSYGQVNAVLGRMLGLEQSVASLEAMTRNLAGTVDSYRATQPPAAPAAPGQIVVLSADGKGVPLRKPAAAPTIAAHDHDRGPKPDRKKMALLGAAYHLEPYPRTPLALVEALFRDPAAPVSARTGPPRPLPQQKRLCALLPSMATTRAAATTPTHPADVLFPWLVGEARQRDPDHQHPWVLLMDGQASLWEAAAAALGATPRVEILDLLHATGYLWEAVHLFQPPGSEGALKWMKLLVTGLLSGMGTGVIRWLQYLAEEGDLPAATGARLDSIHGYFERHRARIQYDQYLAAGYPIAAGVIEGACRHLVKDRLERAGMDWTLPGAQALLNLRCVALNSDWDDFMHYYIHQESAHLYANTPTETASRPLRFAA